MGNAELEAREAKFWEKVDVRSPDECWNWKGALGSSGYAQFRLWIGGKRKNFSGSRVAYSYAVGPIPDRLLACHKCDNPKCVNPNHIFLGTQSDNITDMAAKKRGWRMLNTHCANGHEYNFENTYRRPDGTRDCRTCIRARAKSYKKRKLNSFTSKFGAAA